jgi:hypothetical protein
VATSAVPTAAPPRTKGTQAVSVAKTAVATSTDRHGPTKQKVFIEKVPKIENNQANNQANFALLIFAIKLVHRSNNIITN